MRYSDYGPEYTNYFHARQSRFPILDKLKLRGPWLHILLLVLTFGSTYLLQGIWYSLSIVSILFAHEMGHYLMCRRYGISATLPYFIPFPFPKLNPFGTLGAVIKMKGRIPNRRALFDVGIAGPLAGLAVTIPVLIIGLSKSSFIPLSTVPQGAMGLGDSLLFSQIARLILGATPEGYDMMLHPMAFAGWAGLFVTALNLMPIGQLDGGHILYALFGHKSETIYKFVMIGFIITCAFWYQGWLLLILLLLWFGYRHPAPENDFVPIDTKRKILGYATFVIFIISFVPQPLYIYGN
ncbi:MAG: site-2 protease family protein [Candidatus Zhuqueibacterota bacterium]